MSRIRALISMLLTIVIFSAMVYGQTTFSEDSTVTLFEEDVKVDFSEGLNLPEAVLKGDRIESAKGDIIVDNTGEDMKIKIETYSPDNGINSTAYKVKTREGTDAELTVTGLVDEKYRITVDGELKDEVESTGELSFTLKDFSSTYAVVIDNYMPETELSIDKTSLEPLQSVLIECSAEDNQSGIFNQSLTVEDPEGDIVNHGCNEDFEKTAEEGEYTVKFTATDYGANTASEKDSFSVEEESAGGSGGFSSGSTDKTQESFVKEWDKTSSKQFSIEVDDSVRDIQKVEFNSTTEIGPEKLEITEIEDPSVGKLNNVKRYFEINLKGVEQDKIENSSISFRSKAEWAEGFDSVLMARYSQEWHNLKTEKVDNDEDHVYYRALSPGFSYFAIRGIEQIQEELEDKEARIKVTDIDVELNRAPSDGNITVELENRGNASGEKEFEIGVIRNGELVELLKKKVGLETGETQTVKKEYRFTNDIYSFTAGGKGIEVDLRADIEEAEESILLEIIISVLLILLVLVLFYNREYLKELVGKASAIKYWNSTSEDISTSRH